VLLSFLLAWLTFRFVERPVRTGNRDRKLVTGGLVVGIAAMAVLGLNVGPFARIYDEPIARIVEVWEFSNYPRPAGHFDARYNLLSYGHNEEDKVLIIGESHADQYVNTIAAALQRQASRNESSVPEVMFSTSLVFPPVITDRVLEDKSIKTVVFSYFWALQYRSEKVNTPIRCCGSGLMGVIGIRSPPATAEQMNEIRYQPRKDGARASESGQEGLLHPGQSVRRRDRAPLAGQKEPASRHRGHDSSASLANRGNPEGRAHTVACSQDRAGNRHRRHRPD
jgi:hypothetical protein